MKCRIFSGIMLVLALTACGERVFRGYLQQGQDLYDKGNYVGAYEKWYVLAKQGNADAQVNIGDFYLDLMRNPKLAEYWYDLAEKEGSLRAQFALGNLYEWGGVGGANRTEELALAIIYERSELSIYHRGDLVSRAVKEAGFDVELNPEKALRYYLSAAKRGFSEAQFRLGMAYANAADDGCDPECGAEDNYLQAIHWLELAAGQGHEDAQRHLGYIYFEGSEGVRDFVKSIHWLQSALDGGYLDSGGISFVIGNIYAVGGYGVIKNEEMAMLKYWDAAHLGHFGAMAAGNAMVRKLFPDVLEEDSNYDEIRAWVKSQENALAKRAAWEEKLKELELRDDFATFDVGGSD